MQAVPINGQTWLICGGRDFKDQTMFDSAMSELVAEFGCPRMIVQGGADGADAMAMEWGCRMAIDVQTEPADWMRHGKGAGPIRNQKMLDKFSPRVVIAFPGGAGTLDMVRRAHAAKIATGTPDVIEVKAK